ncbi:unnamed protein product [Lasius platythorax]|uniref:K Homology domain-containing protein n=1 Tax=Lasius platythorax TaxID=488582 RepID=A0AAV2NNK3_9HYME
MKREAEAGAMTGSGGPTSPHKRYRQGDDELRLLIPSKVAGSIIGKGGQNITKLRSQGAYHQLGPAHRFASAERGRT